MKTHAIILMSTLLPAAVPEAGAADPVLVSRSAGKLLQDDSIDLSQRLEATKREKPVVAEDYASTPEAQLLAGVANRHDQRFEIYSADVELLSDLDGDGYHHAISVIFDVDVYYDDATIYAKLYLSRDGEPWSQYFTTQLFYISGAVRADTYEVETELLEGYETGYYAVLVEIYSLHYAYMVTSEVLNYHYLGRDLMIEDLGLDEVHVEPEVETYEEVHYHDHGGNSLASLLLIFLIIRVVIAARGSLALSPRNISDYKNKKNGAP
jgi:hypothetical protein